MNNVENNLKIIDDLRNRIKISYPELYFKDGLSYSNKTTLLIDKKLQQIFNILNKVGVKNGERKDVYRTD